jgi:hypothetical protein
MERESAPGLLQLALGGDTGPTRSVEFGLPRVDWSAEGFDRVAASLRDRGYSAESGSSKRCATVREYLRASAAGSTTELADAGWEMLTSAVDGLGWSPTDAFTVHVESPFTCRGWVRRRISGGHG